MYRFAGGRQRLWTVFLETFRFARNSRAFLNALALATQLITVWRRLWRTVGLSFSAKLPRGLHSFSSLSNAFCLETGVSAMPVRSG